MAKPLLLNLGCGELVGEHWLNLDSSPNVLLDNVPGLKRWLSPLLPASSRTDKFRRVRHFDLRRRAWPFDSQSVDGIYGSHVFEHLSREDGEHVLRESFRVLKPGGALRLLLPCLEELVEQYQTMKRKKEPLAASEFASRSLVLPDPPEGPWWYRLYFRLYDKNRHRMFYDRASLKHYLEANGFARVTVRRPLDSRLPYLHEVEREDRFPGAFCLEAQRPSATRTRGAINTLQTENRQKTHVPLTESHRPPKPVCDLN